MKTIVDAVTHGPNWNSTILLICYDGKLRGSIPDFPRQVNYCRKYTDDGCML